MIKNASLRWSSAILIKSPDKQLQHNESEDHPLASANIGKEPQKASGFAESHIAYNSLIDLPTSVEAYACLFIEIFLIQDVINTLSTDYHEMLTIMISGLYIYTHTITKFVEHSISFSMPSLPE